jgi:thiol-disulfide isomerase/thioredoxin
MKVCSLAPIFLLAAAASAVTAQPPAAPQRPPFPDVTLIDTKGGVQPLKATLGRATVINFWATWCGPCRLELPELQALYDELGGKGVVVLAVNVDSPREYVGPYMKRLGLSLPVYFLEPEAEGGLGIRSLPTTVLLDAAGGVVESWAGYSPESMRELREMAEAVAVQKGGRGGK